MLGSIAKFAGVIALVLLSGCVLTQDQMRTSLALEGIQNPWAIGETRRFTGDRLIWAITDMRPLGSNYCIGLRHYFPSASHPYNDREKRLVRTERTLALSSCSGATPDEFHDIYSEFSESDLAVALDAINSFVHADSAMNSFKVTDNYGWPRQSFQGLVQPNNFWGVFEDQIWSGPQESWGKPTGRMNVEFANENLMPNHIRFSVTIKDGHVTAIEFLNGTTMIHK